MSEEPKREAILSTGLDDGDWTDVVRRATRARRRQEIYGAALLVALAAIVVACSSALGHPIVDFGRAHKAPENVVVNFSSLDQPVPENQGPPADLGPRVLAAQTREIPGLYLYGKPYKLYVAPTELDGVCVSEGSPTPGMCYTRGSSGVRTDTYGSWVRSAIAAASGLKSPTPTAAKKRSPSSGSPRPSMPASSCSASRRRTYRKRPVQRLSFSTTLEVTCLRGTLEIYLDWAYSGMGVTRRSASS